jgi:hypothetical protein
MCTCCLRTDGDEAADAVVQGSAGETGEVAGQTDLESRDGANITELGDWAAALECAL